MIYVLIGVAVLLLNVIAFVSGWRSGRESVYVDEIRDKVNETSLILSKTRRIINEIPDPVYVCPEKGN